MKIAHEIKELEGFAGKAKLYKVDPPMEWTSYKENKERIFLTTHVVVSATNVMFTGPETYIFPSNEKGKITDWGEIDGSYRGGLSLTKALKNAGYEVTT